MQVIILSQLIVLIILFIVWKLLIKEAEAFIKITEAAQQLNNKTLHEAGNLLFNSNRLKFSILLISLMFTIISLIAAVDAYQRGE
ncbi:MAG: hypothetical protein FJ340_05570 [Sphingomonadales bacterium]|nr:hypothetical protein [Sphingomonadales bacterium]